MLNIIPKIIYILKFHVDFLFKNLYQKKRSANSSNEIIRKRILWWNVKNCAPYYIGLQLIAKSAWRRRRWRDRMRSTSSSANTDAADSLQRYSRNNSGNTLGKFRAFRCAQFGKRGVHLLCLFQSRCRRAR